MMKILYQSTNDDGSNRVHIVHTVEKNKIEDVLGQMTDEEYKKHVWDKSIPFNAISPIEIEESTIPKDRTFRDAWTHDGKSFGHDLNKAKEIQLKRIRAQRDPLLYKYDALQLRANDLGDSESLIEIKKKKQKLRDSTNALKALNPSSIDEIKSSIPDLSIF